MECRRPGAVSTPSGLRIDHGGGSGELKLARDAIRVLVDQGGINEGMLCTGSRSRVASASCKPRCCSWVSRFGVGQNLAFLPGKYVVDRFSPLAVIAASEISLRIGSARS